MFKIDKDFFIDWIQKRGLIEYVLNGDVHMEILKRINILLKFLAKNKALKKEYLDLIWKAS